ncbi:hypothetical protein ACLOJK_012004 [Asimina triloba]
MGIANPRSRDYGNYNDFSSIPDLLKLGIRQLEDSIKRGAPIAFCPTWVANPRRQSANHILPCRAAREFVNGLIAVDTRRSLPCIKFTL